ncbi:MAG: Na+:solute symporter, partial [Planctomycetes bacterium]|nr:Na+:solute symporter [Planctomycetota bacterium]
MQLHFVDMSIILLYVVAVVVIGVILSKRAGQDISSYFLGGHRVPWYVLGVSNASSMFDITGTMWLVYILFVYGLKGAFLPWLWPTFNQIFLMIYLAVWIRRSGVLTGGEWMSTRFSSKIGGELARISVTIFAIISVIGFLSYAFQGIGKFAAVFFPWDWTPNTYAIIIMSITTIYVILGGMYSVVVTDLIQFTLLTIVSIAIGIIAMTKIGAADIAAVIPEGWTNILFGWQLNLDWSKQIPSVMDKIADDGYSLFTIVFMMMLFKGFLVSIAGPAPNYDLQRVLATRRPKESAFMSGIVSICLFPRWIMIAGITVLGLVFFSPDLIGMGADIDFEMILPYVVKNFIPVGLMGLLLAGLLAGFMSTFDSTVNAGAAYLVVDIYKRYIKPAASEKNLVVLSYICSFLVVIVGLIFGFLTESINTVMMWIVSGLWGGYTAPNVLKWHWWRLNGHGYFWGMIGGMGAALALPLILPEMSDLNRFPIILVISTLASIIASLMTKPEDDEILKSFYKQVRPWGLWKPVHDMLLQENPDFKPNTAFGRDILNVVIGIVWQMT